MTSVASIGGFTTSMANALAIGRSEERTEMRVARDLRKKAKHSTIPETNIAPEKRPSQRKESYSNHAVSGAFAVSFREGVKLCKVL